MKAPGSKMDEPEKKSGGGKKGSLHLPGEHSHARHATRVRFLELIEELAPQVITDLYKEVLPVFARVCQVRPVAVQLAIRTKTAFVPDKGSEGSWKTADPLEVFLDQTSGLDDVDEFILAHRAWMTRWQLDAPWINRAMLQSLHAWFIHHERLFKAPPSRLADLLGIKIGDLEKVTYYVSYVVTDPGSQEVKFRDLIDEDEYNNLRGKARRDDDDGFRAEIGAEAIQTLLRILDRLEEPIAFPFDGRNQEGRPLDPLKEPPVTWPCPFQNARYSPAPKPLPPWDSHHEDERDFLDRVDAYIADVKTEQEAFGSEPWPRKIPQFGRPEDQHLRWLVRFQVMGETLYELSHRPVGDEPPAPPRPIKGRESPKPKVNKNTVHRGITNAAHFIGLSKRKAKPRRRNR